MISVSGTEKRPALLRSSANAVSTAFAALAPPNSPMNKPGCAPCALSTLLSTGPSLSPAVFLSPRISNSTSAACLSLATVVVRTFCTAAVFETPATTSLTAASKAGVPAGAVPRRAATGDVESDERQVRAGGGGADRGDESDQAFGHVDAEPGADERAADGRREACSLRRGRPVRVRPGGVDAEPDRNADRQRREQLVVEGDVRERSQHDQHCDEPTTEPEHEGLDGAQCRARLPSVGAAPQPKRHRVP